MDTPIQVVTKHHSGNSIHLIATPNAAIRTEYNGESVTEIDMTQISYTLLANSDLNFSHAPNTISTLMEQAPTIKQQYYLNNAFTHTINQLSKQISANTLTRTLMMTNFRQSYDQLTTVSPTTVTRQANTMTQRFGKLNAQIGSHTLKANTASETYTQYETHFNTHTVNANQITVEADQFTVDGAIPEFTLQPLVLESKPSVKLIFAPELIEFEPITAGQFTYYATARLSGSMTVSDGSSVNQATFDGNHYADTAKTSITQLFTPIKLEEFAATTVNIGLADDQQYEALWTMANPNCIRISLFNQALQGNYEGWTYSGTISLELQINGNVNAVPAPPFSLVSKAGVGNVMHQYLLGFPD